MCQNITLDLNNVCHKQTLVNAVRMCVCLCMHVSVHLYIFMWRPEVDSGYLLLYFDLTQNLSLEPEYIISARLADQWDPRIQCPHNHQVCTDIPSLSEQKWLKLKSSCLYSKTFYWSIFPAPIHINISLTYILKIKCLPSSILLVLKARVCRAIIMLTKISLVQFNDNHCL